MDGSVVVVYLFVFSHKKCRLQQAIDWRRQRKMIIQLILISNIYLAFYLPFVIGYIISWFGVSSFYNSSFANCGLFIRVLIQKRRLQQAIDWRRQRKMIIQLILISNIYLAFYLPFVIGYIISWFGVSSFYNSSFAKYSVVAAYFPGALIPYANLSALPQLKQKFRAIMFWKRQTQAAVVPFTRHI
ncbi:hypothetical protein I4U23_005865 [Adineta vaga]|nr:hypothetical protein I4U23_005865 [Adineta vaga]